MSFSLSYKAKKKRIENLPSIMNEIMLAHLKKDALGLVHEFHNGIKNNDLGLEKLKPATIERKRRNGYKKPESPLYGKGDDEKDKSYSNLLRVRQTKNGYTVYPSKAMHWSMKIPLSDLFTIHEHGTKIIMPSGHIVLLPPRPAFLMAYKRWMSKRAKDKRETSKMVKAAIKEIINDADYGRYRRFINSSKKKDKAQD